MVRIFKLWLWRIFLLFLFYALGLLFLLIGGQGVTQSIPFSGLFFILFLFRFIPQSLIYVIPIALFCSFSTVAYHVASHGNNLWFEYLVLFKKSWRQKKIYIMVIVGFLYGSALGWGIPALERSLYDEYKEYGFSYLSRLKTKKLHALQDSFFLYLDERKGKSVYNFFCNVVLDSSIDFIFSAQESVLQKNFCSMHSFEGLLVHKNKQAIRMQVQHCSIDLNRGYTLLLDQKVSSYSLGQLLKEVDKKDALIELCKRLCTFFFCLLMPFFGWRRGEQLAEQRRSFVFLLWNGIMLLLFLYLLLHSFSWCSSI